MITPDSMQKDANLAIDIYAQMEQDIYALIFKTIKTTKYDSIDTDNALAWQLEQLSKMGVLNKQVIQLVSKYTHKSEEAIEHLVQDNGIQIVDEVDQELSDLLHKKVDVGDDTRDIINSQLNQTMHDLDNTVSQTLLTTSMGHNPAMQVFQNIVKQTTVETVVGLKTHNQALNETCEKWVSNGIPVLVDKAGRKRSIEGYARTVINTTAHRTFNDLRLKRMEDYDTHLALMSSHPAAREACAPIQGKVINLVPTSSKDFNPKYDSIYNHGYGEPSGTQGVNCTHTLYPFIEGVNTNNQPQYDPEEAQENGELQAKQRGYERAIRDTKKKLEAAKALGDESGIQKYKAQLAAQQKRLREFIKPHDFLHRDYSREKIFTGNSGLTKRAKKKVSNQSLSPDYDYFKPGDEENSFLAKQRDKRWNSLTDEQKDLLSRYTQGIASEWNSAATDKYFNHDWFIKSGGDKHLKNSTGYTVEEYREMMKKLCDTPLGKNVRLFRGVGESEFNWMKDSNYWSAATSTATNDSQNDFFSRIKNGEDITPLGYRVNIYATPGTKGFFIGKKTSYEENQFEYLLSPDSKYRILPSSNDHVINAQVFAPDATVDFINKYPLPNLGKDIMEKTKSQIAKEEQEAENKAKQNAIDNAVKEMSAEISSRIGIEVTNKKGVTRVIKGLEVSGEGNVFGQVLRTDTGKLSKISYKEMKGMGLL